MDRLLLLKSIPLLRGLPEEHLESLARHAHDKVYPVGARIVNEDDPIRAYFIVVSGRVKVFKSSVEGKEQTLYIMGPGEPFCLCTAFGDRTSPVNAEALEEARLVFFPGKVLEDLARTEPSLMFNMLLVLSRRLREAMTMIESLSLLEIPQRLAGFLLHSLRMRGTPLRNGVSLELDITQRELSKILGTTPETLNRVLKRMNRDGVLDVRNRKVEVFDVGALECLSKTGDCP